MRSAGSRGPGKLHLIIKNFTPAWFSATMGTGSIAMLFHAFPFGSLRALRPLSAAFLILDTALLALLAALLLLRTLRFPKVWRAMMRHPAQNLYLGCAPMGLDTILNVATQLVYAEYHVGGPRFLWFLWAVWWVDVGVSCWCCWVQTHYMFTRQTHHLAQCTTLWLLPVVTLIVGSSAGGILASALVPVDRHAALATAGAAACMVTIGLTLATMHSVLYLARLILHGVPQGEMMPSIWINLGPAGQAGFSILQTGAALRALLPPASADTVYVLTVCASCVLWALATLWAGFCVVACLDRPARKARTARFSVSWWGMIFPNGVYANLTIALGRTLDLGFFRVLGAAWAVFTMLLWAAVAGATARNLRGARVLLVDSGLGVIGGGEAEKGVEEAGGEAGRKEGRGDFAVGRAGAAGVESADSQGTLGDGEDERRREREGKPENAV